MVKRRRLNKRLDASHARLYQWLLDSPAYLSLSCQARAVLLEIARGHDGMNNSRLGLSIRRASERCNIARGTAARAFVELQERGFIDCMTKGAFNLKGTARQRMASDLVELRCYWRPAQQKVHGLGPRKTKRGIKISRHGIKSEPPCRMKRCNSSLTVPSIDTVRTVSVVVPVSI